MARAAETVTVNRPIAEVFEFLADGMNEQSWRPDVISIDLVTGTGPGVGTFTIDLTPKGAMVLMKGMIAKQVAIEAANIRNVPQAMGA